MFINKYTYYLKYIACINKYNIHNDTCWLQSTVALTEAHAWEALGNAEYKKFENKIQKKSNEDQASFHWAYVWFPFLNVKESDRQE